MSLSEIVCFTSKTRSVGRGCRSGFVVKVYPCDFACAMSLGGVADPVTLAPSATTTVKEDRDVLSLQLRQWHLVRQLV